MKCWEENYKGNTIRVENRWDGEKLFINGQLQDEQIGCTTRARLWGKLQTGETIKVSLGGTWTIRCIIFVDHKVILRK